MISYASLIQYWIVTDRQIDSKYCTYAWVKMIFKNSTYNALTRLHLWSLDCTSLHFTPP